MFTLAIRFNLTSFTATCRHNAVVAFGDIFITRIVQCFSYANLILIHVVTFLVCWFTALTLLTVPRHLLWLSYLTHKSIRQRNYCIPPMWFGIMWAFDPHDAILRYRRAEHIIRLIHSNLASCRNVVFECFLGFVVSVCIHTVYLSCLLVYCIPLAGRQGGFCILNQLFAQHVVAPTNFVSPSLLCSLYQTLTLRQ